MDRSKTRKADYHLRHNRPHEMQEKEPIIEYFESVGITDKELQESFVEANADWDKGVVLNLDDKMKTDVSKSGSDMNVRHGSALAKCLQTSEYLLQSTDVPSFNMDF